MKISICDVCVKEKKTVKATYRSGWRNGLKIDLCEEHKDFLKGKKQTEVTNWLFGDV